MKSTIDLAREANADITKIGFLYFTVEELEAFRALCVAEEHKRLLGAGSIDPLQQIMSAARAWYLSNTTSEGLKASDALVERVVAALAAARFQGATESLKACDMPSIARLMDAKAQQRITELEDALREIAKNKGNGDFDGCIARRALKGSEQ